MSQSTTESFILAGAGKFLGIFLTFAFNWLLARYFLTPYDFGLLGMVYVLVSLANTTMIGGLGQAVIQREVVSKADLDTVFTFNFALSLAMYALMYFLAPSIAKFYNNSELILIVRVLSLLIIINAFVVVQNALIIRHMKYKKLLLITLISQFFGYAIGVVMAVKRLGVWSLVCANLGIIFSSAILYRVTSDYIPAIRFSKQSFQKMFSYGGLLYLSTLTKTIYDNALYLILGKRYSPMMVGYYTQAEKLQGVPNSSITEIIYLVTLPLFSKSQSDQKELRQKFIKNQYAVSYVSCFIMGLLLSVSEPLIILLYTNKWMRSVPIFQWLCIAGFFLAICNTHLELIKSVGRAMTHFKLTLGLKLTSLIVLIFCSLISLRAVLIGFVLSNLAIFLIAASITRRLLDVEYDLLIFPHLLTSFISVSSAIIPLMVINHSSLSDITMIILSALLFCATFIVSCHFSKNRGYLLVTNALRNKLKHFHFTHIES